MAEADRLSSLDVGAECPHGRDAIRHTTLPENTINSVIAAAGMDVAVATEIIEHVGREIGVFRSGQEPHRRARQCLADPLEYVPAMVHVIIENTILRRYAPVEKHDVEWFVTEGRKRTRLAFLPDDIAAVHSPERLLDRCGEVGLVLDQQDPHG